MELVKIHSFLKKNNFLENKGDGSYTKRVD